LEAGQYGELCPSKITLFDLLTRYLREVTPQKRGKAPEARRLNRLLKDSISLHRLNELSPHRLAEFRDRRLIDGVRACQYDLALIRHCIKLAINEWGLTLDKNPADTVKKPSSSPARDRRLTTEELQALIKASSQTRNTCVLPVVLFAIETGMRRSEILSLEWQLIDFNKHTALLPLTKNGSSREVPLSPKAIDILSSQSNLNTPKPFPINANAFRLAWDRLKVRANIDDLKFHDLRHEAISRFFEAGLSLVEVATISGHKDPKMLFRYTHLKAEDIAEKLR
jgi:integrase